jgi:hypothetical protein
MYIFFKTAWLVLSNFELKLGKKSEIVRNCPKLSEPIFSHSSLLKIYFKVDTSVLQ